MTMILKIEREGDYFTASLPNGLILFGGAENNGGVDGTDAAAVIQAAIDKADAIHTALLDVSKRGKK